MDAKHSLPSTGQLMLTLRQSIDIIVCFIALGFLGSCGLQQLCDHGECRARNMRSLYGDFTVLGYL